MNLLKIAAPLIGLAMFGAACTDSTDTTDHDTTDRTGTPVETVPFQTTPTTTDLPDYVPSIDDFAISVYVVESSCYGSAGGLVTVEPDIAYNGPDFEGRYELQYQINGDEHGPIITTATVSDDGTYEYYNELVSTPSCNAEVTMSILSLREDPYSF